MNRIVAQAPSNIAIVKYMGKVDSSQNLPANPSLSMTLQGLRTEVDLRWISGDGPLQKKWIPDAEMRGYRAPILSEAGEAKVMRHLDRVFRDMPAQLSRYDLKAELPLQGHLEIRSANTFPEAAGIASSASSFAALTLAATAMLCRSSLEQFEKLYHSSPEFKRALAGLSRQGSGSSCRSFEGPWVQWENASVESVPTRLPALSDLVILVGRGSKAVSSSEAHQRVLTSPLWSGRVERATGRVHEARQAIQSGEWKKLVACAWQELWEMHSLFHTSTQNFTYWLPESLAVLKWIQPMVERAECLVTMDAGPHLHVLVPQDHAQEWLDRIQQQFSGMEVLRDQQGWGASLCSN